MSLRVLVVDDSVTVRKRLCEVLGEAPGFEVVGEACDGKQAIELCQKLRPDVVTMDIVLPVMSGLAATEYIMAYCPTPILVVSSSFNRGELFKTFEALAAGAVEVLEKPCADQPEGEWEQRLISTVRLVSKVKVITHPRARLGRSAQPASPPPSRRAAASLLALGTSTGGPGALVRVLNDLPATCQLPVLGVIHLNHPFGHSFTEWLDGQVPRRVRYVQEGESWSSATGQVLLAPPGRHVELRGARLYLSDAPERHSCRPSVDVLFESLAREVGPATVAALMTGMGRDGAAGLLAIRQAGGYTLAQDEASCVVYGMPREAVLLGAARQVCPLDELGRALAQAAQGEPVR